MNAMKRLATAIVAAMSSGACAHGDHHHHHGFADASGSAKVLDDPARDAWQRPDDVLRALELTPTMTVADVGAGTGYFSVRLARLASQVIATDVEPNMVAFLTERAKREHLANVRAVLASQAASGLKANSVDRILVAHVWHHLDNRVHYARDLANALKPEGRLVVVDFRVDAERGPPLAMRVSPEALVAELTNAGLIARVLPIDLPDQYIVEGRLPVGR